MIKFLAYGYIAVLLLTIFALALFFSGRERYGPVSDVLQAISGLFLFGLIWSLSVASSKGASISFIFGRILGIAGVLLLLYGAIRTATGDLIGQYGGIYVSTGYGLMGIWLLLVWPSASRNFSTSSGRYWLGLATAMTMTIGLLGILPLLTNLSVYSPIMDIAVGATGVIWLLSLGWSFLLTRG